MDATNAIAFADSVVPQAMQDGKTPGAVFVVVRDDRVLVKRAFGVADLKTRKPVSTDRTLFRVASISKIFTAASALQLVHARRLDLHRDVNDYLARFQIEPAFGEPVTLFNLLTHSAGFDDSPFDYAARSATNRLSLGDYLIKRQPERVRPPGEFVVYDNYGFALAGYLVQKASGVPFADYARKHLLAPLDMEHSSFRPGPALRKHLATGYWLDEGTPRACGPSYVNITPAAGLCTTAGDMADFMIALVANRRPDGAKFVTDDVIRGLETVQFNPQTPVPGQCFGFNHVTIAGRSALRQPGQWPGFNSVLMLFPKQRCAIFLAYNLCDYEQMDKFICRKFAEKFIAPDAGSNISELSTNTFASTNFQPLLGSYQSSRISHDSPRLIFPREIAVTLSNDGQLELNGRPCREIQPMVFERLPTNTAGSWFGERVSFELDSHGQASHLITQNGAFHRIPWFVSRHGRTIVMRTLTIVMLSAVILWLVTAFIRFIFASAPHRTSRPQRRQPSKLSLAARGTALAACSLALWFEASYAFAELNLKPFATIYGFPPALQNLMWALPVLLTLTGALAMFSLLAWKNRLWHPLHRLHYTVLTIALALFVYFFYSRNLLFVG